MHDAAFDRHQQAARPLQEHGRGIRLHEDRGFARARARDLQHKTHRRNQERTGERAAGAGIEERAQHRRETALLFPARRKKPAEEIKPGKQRGGEHEIVIGQSVQAAGERKEQRPAVVLHRLLHPEKDQRKESDDFPEVIKLRVHGAEGRKSVQDRGKQRDALVAKQPA